MPDKDKFCFHSSPAYTGSPSRKAEINQTAADYISLILPLLRKMLPSSSNTANAR